MLEESQAAAGLRPGQQGYRAVLTALAIGGFITFSNFHFTQPLLPVLSEYWQISPVLVSLSVSLTIFTMSACLLFYGSLSDRTGRKNLIVWTSMLAALPTLFAAAAPTFPWLLAARTLQGVFLAGLPAVAMAYVGEEVDTPFVGMVMGLYISGTSIGGMGGRIISGVINDWIGWRAAFLVIGCTTLLGALLMGALLPPSRRFQRSSYSPLHGIRQHLSSVQLWPAFAVGCFWMFAFVGLFNYVGFYLGNEPFHLSPGQVGLLYLTYLSGTITAPLTGHSIDRFGFTGTVSWTTLLALAGVLLTGIHSLFVIIVGLLLFAVGFFMSHVSASGFVSQMAVENKAAATALYLTFYYLGGSVGSTALGVLWTNYHWIGVEFGVAASLLMVIWSSRFMRKRSHE